MANLDVPFFCSRDELHQVDIVVISIGKQVAGVQVWEGRKRGREGGREEISVQTHVLYMYIIQIYTTYTCKVHSVKYTCSYVA